MLAYSKAMPISATHHYPITASFERNSHLYYYYAFYVTMN